MSEKLAILGGSKAIPDDILAKRIFWPYVTDEDKEAVNAVLDRGILFGHTEADGRVVAPETEALQKEFADYIGTKYCLAVNSGTAALHIALVGCEIECGDEVITSAFSYVATPMAILHARAIPIFVDVDINTQNIDIYKIEEEITSRTRVIMPVHMNGVPCEMDKILQLAKKHNLYIIEDSAQAWGSVYNGQKIGGIGHAAGFSLNGTKNFSVGEGGLFVTNDKEIYLRAKAIATMGSGPGESFGKDYSDKRFQHLITYNYKVQELTSALARSRLRQLDGINRRGFENAKLLNHLLKKTPNAALQIVPENSFSTFYKYRLRINTKNANRNLRDRIFLALKAENVDVTMWQQDPLPYLPAFRNTWSTGHGCPWNHSVDSNYFTNYTNRYLSTQTLLDTSLIICSESYPIFCQPTQVIEGYAAGINKIFENLDQLL